MQPVEGHGDAGAAAGRRRTLLICLLLALAAGAIRLPRLGIPATVVYDEEFQVATARAFLQGRNPPDISHPPVARLLTAAGIFYFGLSPAGWRMPSALAGMLLVPAAFLLGRMVLRHERAALLAATLLLLDGQPLVQSRLATTNVFAVLFQVAAAYLMLRAALAERLRAGSLMGAALCAGLALSTRWSSVAVVGFLALVLLCVRRERLRERREMSLLLAAAALIPLVYAASYIPWMAQGHSLADLVRLQQRMLETHSAMNETHRYGSPWYTWPWLVRPSLYFYEPPTPAYPFVVVVMAIGNPAVWWLSVPASLAALVIGIRRRDPRPLFCAAGFACAYLFWAVAARPLQFAHYFLDAVPYACLSLGFLLDRAWDGRWRWLCRAYVVLAVLLALYFYPVQTAVPIPASLFFHRLFAYVYPWRWLPTW